MPDINKRGCPFEYKMQQTYATLLDAAKRLTEDSERFRKSCNNELDRIEAKLILLRKDMFDAGCSRISPSCEFMPDSPACGCHESQQQ